MANYDDIFNASAQKGTEDKSFVSFNKEEWAAQKNFHFHSFTVSGKCIITFHTFSVDKKGEQG